MHVVSRLPSRDEDNGRADDGDTDPHETDPLAPDPLVDQDRQPDQQHHPSDNRNRADALPIEGSTHVLTPSRGGVTLHDGIPTGALRPGGLRLLKKAPTRAGCKYTVPEPEGPSHARPRPANARRGSGDRALRSSDQVLPSFRLRVRSRRRHTCRDRTGSRWVVRARSRRLRRSKTSAFSSHASGSIPPALSYAPAKPSRNALDAPHRNS